MWVEIIVPSLPFSPGDPVIRISALHKKIPKIPARYSAWNCVHVVFGCTMGLFWEGKRILHWLLRGEVTGVAKGLSLSLAIFTLSYPLFNTPLKNPFFAPLYAYLRTSISTRDFHQIVSQFFSRNLRMSRIVLRGNAPSGAQRNHNDDRNEKISETKTLNVQRNFWRVSLPSLHDSSCQSWLKWHCDRRFTI